MNDINSKPKPKAPIKCECGQEVCAGSVFCAPCKEEILKKNSKMIAQEEKKYQIKMKINTKGAKNKRSATPVLSR